MPHKAITDGRKRNRGRKREKARKKVHMRNVKTVGRLKSKLAELLDFLLRPVYSTSCTLGVLEKRKLLSEQQTIKSRYIRLSSI